MFTINIRDIVAVGKSGMKWNLNTGNYTDKQNEQIPSDSNAASKAVVEAANNPAASPALKADVQEVIKSAKKEEKELQIDIGAASDFKATLDKGPDGKVKLGSMTAIIAAGDDNIVESRNVGWIGRNLLSKGEQKFSFGELQIYNRLMANIKTPAELDALAVRIGAQPLPWNTTLDDISIHRDTAINDFRDKMAQRVSEMATIGQLTLGERGAVAGLESVISGRTDQFKQALTANKDTLKQAAQKLSNNASGLETFLNTLAKIGIILPLNILSNYGVLLTADSKNVDKKLGTTGGLETKFAQFGEAGNLAASIKAIGLAIDVNTNDPSQRITHRTADFLKAVEAKDADVMKASEVVVTKAKEDNKNLSTEDLTKLENLSKNYISIQKTSVDTVATNNNIDPKVYGDILADQTFRYLSQVEELKWFQFKGGFAALSLSMVGIGASFAKINTSFTQEGVSTSAALGEAMAHTTEFKNSAEKKLYIETNVWGGIKYGYDPSTKIESLSLPSKAISKEIIAQMGATATEKDGITTIVFPLTKTFNIRNLVKADGSQSIMIDTYDRKTVSVAPAANAQPVVSTPPMLIISAVTEIKNVRESNEGLAAMKKDIYNMSRDAKGNPEFTDALIAIGKMEYNTAYDILIAASVKNPKIKAIVAQYNRDNVSQLQAINTYTYGARSSMDVKNQVAVSAKEYNAMRSLNGVEPAEKKLGVYNIDAEKFFQSTAWHRAKDISATFSGMSLSISVYATPKGGTHRIDTFSGSIQASDAIYIGNFSDAQKDQILKNGAKNTQVAYDLFKQDFGKVVSWVTLADYTSYTKTGMLAPSMAGLSVTQAPVFFEARAMVHGNLCSNKCEGVGYPRFSYQGKHDTPPPPPLNVENFPLGSGSTGTPGVIGKTSQIDLGVGLGVKLHKAPTEEPAKPANSADSLTDSRSANGSATWNITNGTTTTLPIAQQPIHFALPTQPIVALGR